MGHILAVDSRPELDGQRDVTEHLVHSRQDPAELACAVQDCVTGSG